MTFFKFLRIIRKKIILSQFIIKISKLLLLKCVKFSMVCLGIVFIIFLKIQESIRSQCDLDIPSLALKAMVKTH